MFTVVKRWTERYLSNPQAILLLMMIGGGLLLILWMGNVLAPVIASVVIAYLLQWLARRLMLLKVPRLVAVIVVYLAFLSIFLSAILILWPIIAEQLTRLFEEFPKMITSFQHFLYLLPEQFPQYLTKEIIDGWVASLFVQLKLSGKVLFERSLASLPSVIALVVYLFLVPLMVFFFLKDYPIILNWFKRFLPQDRAFISSIGQNVHKQIGNYILGKGAEVLIVGVSTFLVFYCFDMLYATLLAVLVGFSVLLPYIGAVIVTIPVILVAFFQWGFGHQFAYLLIGYGVIQALDGVILVPLLFAEAVNLHPLAIIIAILVFGAWWGFWGVFFAIPLATLVQAIIEGWPQKAT